MKVLPFGDRAILAEFTSLQETMGAFRRLDLARRPGIIELVPAASTILIRVDPMKLSLSAVEQWLTGELEHAETSDLAEESRLPSVIIPVRYNGADLSAVAEILGISETELISRHSLAKWRCAFIGFIPGFAYLATEHAEFDIPRHHTSRTVVPAGSVGLAGEFTGIYPRNSPGGWQLIGTTDVTLWDETREPPAEITPGMTVRFQAVER